MAKKTGSKPLTKTEILRNISESTGLAKKDVVAVLEELTSEIHKALKGSGIGVFSIPGLGRLMATSIVTRVPVCHPRTTMRPGTPGFKGTFACGIADGRIVGYYEDGSASYYGFVFDGTAYVDNTATIVVTGANDAPTVSAISGTTVVMPSAGLNSAKIGSIGRSTSPGWMP